METKELLKLMWEYTMLKRKLDVLSRSDVYHVKTELDIAHRLIEIESILDKELNDTN